MKTSGSRKKNRDIGLKKELTPESLIEARRRWIYIFTAFIVPIVLILGTISTRHKSLTVYGIELIICAILIINTLMVYRYNKVELGATILAVFSIFLSAAVFLVGGVEGTGRLWMIVVPFYLYFLKGVRKGTYFFFFLSALTALISVLMIVGVVDPLYSVSEIRQFWLIFLFAGFLAHFQEKSKEETFFREQQARQDLALLNENLEERILKELEDRRANEQLLIQQSRLAAMGEMIGAIAHQWRQPINSLGLMVQDLEDACDYKELDEKYVRSVVPRAMEQIDYMSKTIDDFRSYFKPSRTQEAFDLKTSIHEATSIIMPQLMAHGIILFMEIPESSASPMHIMGYKNEFKQVLINLINNARLAIQTRMELQRDRENGTISITLERIDATFRISIQDNGGGIPESIGEKIFDPYFTTRDEGQGTGLGLYMSRMIIEKNMKGRIFFENREDGACFLIEFAQPPEM